MYVRNNNFIVSVKSMKNNHNKHFDMIIMKHTWMVELEFQYALNK